MKHASRITNMLTQYNILSVVLDSPSYSSFFDRGLRNILLYQHYYSIYDLSGFIKEISELLGDGQLVLMVVQIDLLWHKFFNRWSMSSATH